MEAETSQKAVAEIKMGGRDIVSTGVVEMRMERSMGKHLGSQINSLRVDWTRGKGESFLEEPQGQ